MTRRPFRIGRPSWGVLLLLVGQTAHAERESPGESPLAIESDSSCPSADAVGEALRSLRPAGEWPHTAVTIRTSEQRLLVELGSPSGYQRQLALGPDCATRASIVALVIATWMNDLPAEAASVPILRAGASGKLANTVTDGGERARAADNEISIAAIVAGVGGIAPALRLDFQRHRAKSSIGWQAVLVLPAARDLSIAGGTNRWTRLSAMTAACARSGGNRVFLTGSGGVALGYTLAWGTGYAANQTDQSLTYGLVAGTRAGLGVGQLRLFIDVTAMWWLYRQHVQVDGDANGGSATRSLPAWDLQAGIGVTYVFH